MFENQTRLPGGQWIYMSDNYTDVVRGALQGQVGSAFLKSWTFGPRRGMWLREGCDIFSPAPMSPASVLWLTEGRCEVHCG